MMKYKRDGRWLTVEQLKEYEKNKLKISKSKPTKKVADKEQE